jgi:hypothetical protein
MCKSYQNLVDEGRSSIISLIGQSISYLSRCFESRNSRNSLVSREGRSAMLCVTQLQLNVVETSEEEIVFSKSDPNIEETKEVES